MKASGFTLLETIIYLALFSVLMSGALLAVYQLLESTAINQTALSVQAEALFVNQKFSWALSGATEVLVVSSTTLRIVRPDIGSDSPIDFVAQNGAWYIARGTIGGRDVLTSPQYQVSQVELSVIVGAHQRVRILYWVQGTPFAYETMLPI